MASAAIAAGLIAAAATFWLTLRFGPVAVTCIAAAAWRRSGSISRSRRSRGLLVGLDRRRMLRRTARDGPPRRRGGGAGLVRCDPGGCGPDRGAAPYDPPHRVLLTPGPTVDGTRPRVALPPARGRRDRRLGSRPRAPLPHDRRRSPEGGWRIALDIDADRGGVLVLDQTEEGGRWRLPAVRGMGVAIDVRGDATQARLVATEPGRHLVELDLLPAVTRRGAVEESSIRIPPAPQSTVEAAGARDMRGWQCERADREGPWRPVTTGTGAAGGAFDVSRAARVAAC